MKIEKEHVSNQNTILRDIYEHEVLLSFNDDDKAYAFNDWWNTKGFNAFQKFYETWEA